MTSEVQQRVGRAVAWVGLASAVVAVFDAIALALLMWLWVTPEQLGIATLAVSLYYFLDLVTEAGMSSVLIQRDSLDEDTISSVFWLNAIVSAGVFLAVLGVGPLIGALHGQPIVGWMLIAYGTKLLYQNVYFVPAALLRRELRYKELSIVRTVANAGDLAAKVGFAAMGEPIWCFVAGWLARVVITGIGLQLCRPWRPRLVFRRAEARGMLAFGFQTTASQYLQHFYNNISYQVVGFAFGEAALGVYRVAYELVLYPVNWVSNVVAQVAFPAFARLRGDALAQRFLRFSRQNLAVAMPLLVLVLVAADELLRVLFPGVAGGAATARLLCLVGLLRAVDCLYLPLLDGVGRAASNVRVAAIAAVVLTACDVAFAAGLGELGFVAVALGRIVGYPIVIAVHARAALGPIGVGARRYLGPIARLVAWGAIAATAGVVARLVVPPLVAAALALAVLGGLLAGCERIGLRGLLRRAP